jgi:hypothetical protein
VRGSGEGHQISDSPHRAFIAAAGDGAIFSASNTNVRYFDHKQNQN